MDPEIESTKCVAFNDRFSDLYNPPIYSDTRMCLLCSIYGSDINSVEIDVTSVNGNGIPLISLSSIPAFVGEHNSTGFCFTIPTQSQVISFSFSLHIIILTDLISYKETLNLTFSMIVNTILNNWTIWTIQCVSDDKWANFNGINYIF